MPFYDNAEDSPNFHPNCVCAASACKKGISQKQSVCMCSSCHGLFHPPCKGIIGASKIKKAADSNWICSPDCGKTSTINLGSSHSGTPTNNETEIMIRKLRKYEEEFSEIKNLIKEVKISQDFMNSEFEKMKTEYKKAIADNKELLNVLRLTKEVNTQQEQRINALEATVDDLHQAQIETNLVISGIPNESIQPQQVLLKIFDLLDCNESIEEVRNVEFMKRRVFQNTSAEYVDAKILVTFKSKEGKYRVQERKKKKLIHLSQVGFALPIDRQIYFRDHLTHHRLKLYREARKVNKIIKYKYLWINKSVIYFRREDRAPVIRITSQNDIDKLLSAHNVNPELLG